MAEAAAASKPVADATPTRITLTDVDGRIVGSDAPLIDGAEVALLPPVSGGSGAEAPLRAALVDGPIDVGRVTAAVGGPAHGAVVLFLGTVREGQVRTVATGNLAIGLFPNFWTCAQLMGFRVIRVVILIR